MKVQNSFHRIWQKTTQLFTLIRQKKSLRTKSLTVSCHSNEVKLGHFFLILTFSGFIWSFWHLNPSVNRLTLHILPEDCRPLFLSRSQGCHLALFEIISPFWNYHKYSLIFWLVSARGKEFGQFSVIILNFLDF